MATKAVEQVFPLVVTMKGAKFATREEWMASFVGVFGRAWVETNAREKLGGVEPKLVRVSVGKVKPRAVAECWHSENSADGAFEIFVTPEEDDAFRVGDNLLHELAHAWTPGDGHGKGFVKFCNGVGLTKGKPRFVGAGPELEKLIKSVAASLGKFPHAALNMVSAAKPGKNRQRLMECKQDGYKVRASAKSIITHGPVICPTCEQAMEVVDAVEDANAHGVKDGSYAEGGDE